MTDSGAPPNAMTSLTHARGSQGPASFERIFPTWFEDLGLLNRLQQITQCSIKPNAKDAANISKILQPNGSQGLEVKIRRILATCAFFVKKIPTATGVLKNKKVQSSLDSTARN